MDTPSGTQAPLGERVRNTFLAPSRLGVALRDNGPWIDVLLISTLIAVASIASVPDEVFVADMQDAVTRRGAPVDIVSSPEVIGRWGRLMGMLATVATHPVIPFVVAGIVFAVFAFLFRASTTYRQLLAIASHAMLIPAAGTVLRVIGRGAGIRFIETDPTWPLAWRAALSIDPYIVWMLVVIAVAAHALDPRLSRARAGAVLIGGYLALVFSSTAILHPAGERANALTAPAAAEDAEPTGRKLEGRLLPRTSAPLASGNRQPATSNRQPATGNRQLVTGNWQLTPEDED